MILCPLSLVDEWSCKVLVIKTQGREEKLNNNLNTLMTKHPYWAQWGKKAFKWIVIYDDSGVGAETNKLLNSLQGAKRGLCWRLTTQSHREVILSSPERQSVLLVPGNRSIQVKERTGNAEPWNAWVSQPFPCLFFSHILNWLTPVYCSEGWWYPATGNIYYAVESYGSQPNINFSTGRSKVSSHRATMKWRVHNLWLWLSKGMLEITGCPDEAMSNSGQNNQKAASSLPLCRVHSQ